MTDSRVTPNFVEPDEGKISMQIGSHFYTVSPSEYQQIKRRLLSIGDAERLRDRPAAGPASRFVEEVA